jgi:hypothetical protein
MKYQRGSGGFATLVVLFLIVAWFVNVSQLLGCDFKAPYKCEVIHTIGVFVPPAQAVTVFFTEDK